MNTLIQELLNSLRCNPPAHENDLARLRGLFHNSIDSDFLDFITYADGAEGDVKDNYLMIYSIHDIIEVFHLNNTDPDYSSIFVFASNGGIIKLAFSVQAPHRVFLIDYYDFNLNTVLGNSFAEFIQLLQTKEALI